MKSFRNFSFNSGIILILLKNILCDIKKKLFFHGIDSNSKTFMKITFEGTSSTKISK